MNIIEELRNTSKLVDTFGTEGDGNLHLKAADEIDELTNQLYTMGNVLGQLGEFAGVQQGDYDGLIKWADAAKQKVNDGGDVRSDSEIKAEAIIQFVGMMIDVYATGFVDTHMTSLADIYQTARQHVKRKFNVEIQSLDDLVGEEFAHVCLYGK